MWCGCKNEAGIAHTLGGGGIDVSRSERRAATGAYTDAAGENGAGSGIGDAGPIDQGRVVGLIEEIGDVAGAGSDAERGGSGIQIQAAAAEHKGADGGLFENNPAAGAENGLAGAENIPGKAEAWRQIVVGRWVRGADAFADLNDAGMGAGGEEIGEKVSGVLDGRSNVVAQAHIDGQTGFNAIAILNKETDGFEVHVAGRVAVEFSPSFHVAGGEILERIEIDAAAAVGGTEIVDGAVAVIAAEAQGVFSASEGSGIGNIFGAAGSGFEGPTGIAAHVVWEI